MKESVVGAYGCGLKRNYVCMYVSRKEEGKRFTSWMHNEMGPDRMQKMFEWYAQILIPMCFAEADCHLGYIMARL